MPNKLNLQPLELLDLGKCQTVSQIVDGMSRCAFGSNARRRRGNHHLVLKVRQTRPDLRWRPLQPLGQAPRQTSRQKSKTVFQRPDPRAVRPLPLPIPPKPHQERPCHRKLFAGHAPALHARSPEPPSTSINTTCAPPARSRMAISPTPCLPTPTSSSPSWPSSSMNA